MGTIAVELYEGDDAVLRELIQAIQARATAIREQLRLFPALVTRSVRKRATRPYVPPAASLRMG